MSTTTTRRALVKPATSDSGVTSLRTSIATNADKLDGSVAYSQGTWAARPGAALSGDLYLATDQTAAGILWAKTPAGWVQMSVPLITGTTAFPSGAALADGMMVRLMPDVANTRRETWLCRYDAGRVAPSRWQVVEARPLFSAVEAEGTVTWTAYSDIAGNDGPRIVIPRAGIYDFDLFALGVMGPTPYTHGSAALHLDGTIVSAGLLDFNGAQNEVGSFAPWQSSGTAAYDVVCALNAVAKMRYRVDLGGESLEVKLRRLAAIPRWLT